MILVAGGTGLLGGHLVEMLERRGEDVRVLTRHPVRTSTTSARFVLGDVRDASAVDAAVAGCSTIISAVHGFTGGRGAGPEAVDRDGNVNLIEAARAHGVDRFVLMSVMDAGPDHPMSLHRMKFAAEEALRRTGLTWTIVRPSAYLQTWCGVIGAKVGSGGPAIVFGRGDNPVNFVSARDVATVVDIAFDDPTYAHRRIDLGGPDNLTLNEFARQLLARRTTSDRAGGITHIPRPVLRVTGALVGPVHPLRARQARTAVAMDTMPMSFDNTALRNEFPGIAWQTLRDVLDDPAPHPAF